jgi:sugar phosphate isomerase/epimerase
MTAARILFSTGSLYVFDLSYCFELAAEAGYDGVEVMCDDRYSTRDPDYLKRMSQQYKLPVCALHTPFSPKLPGWRDAAHDEVKRICNTLQLAETIGAEVIVVHVPRKVGWASLSVNGRTFRFPWRMPLNPVKNWIERELPAVQEKTNVKIALENMPAVAQFRGKLDPTWWNEVETWSRAHRWLTMDTTHWATKRVNPLDAYHAAGERIAHVHLSNFDGHEHILPFKGSLNLKSLLRAMAAEGFAGTISLELNPYSLVFKEPAVLRHNLRESLEFCRANLR